MYPYMGYLIGSGATGIGGGTGSTTKVNAANLYSPYYRFGEQAIYDTRKADLLARFQCGTDADNLVLLLDNDKE